MKKTLITAPLHLAALLVAVALAGALGHQAGRVEEARRAQAAAEHAAAAMEGMLGVCRERTGTAGQTRERPPVPVVSATLG